MKAFQTTSINISLASGRWNKGTLSVEGSILIFKASTWWEDKTIQIPIEIVSIKGKKMRTGFRLITAMLALLIFLPISAILTQFPNFYGNLLKNYGIISVNIIGLIVLILPFISLFIRYLIPQHAVVLQLLPNYGEIVFWSRISNTSNVSQFLQELRYRQCFLEKENLYPIDIPVEFNLKLPNWLHPYYKWESCETLGIKIFSFSLPAIILEKIYFLILCSIPLVSYIWKRIQAMKAPYLFRHAIYLCTKNRWPDAYTAIQALFQKSSYYFPGYLLLIWVLIHLNRFNEAISVFKNIQDKINPIDRQSIFTDIELCSIVAKRLKQNIPRSSE